MDVRAYAYVPQLTTDPGGALRGQEASLSIQDAWRRIVFFHWR